MNNNKGDLYSVGFWSLGWLEKRYGRDSLQVKVAFGALADAALKLAQQLEHLYDGMILEEMLFVSNPFTSSSRVKEIKDTLNKNIPASHLSKQFSLERYYPNVYLNDYSNNLGNSDLSVPNDFCVLISDTLQQKLDLKFNKGDVEAVCVPARTENEVVVDRRKRDVIEASEDTEAATFQVALWVTIALFIAFGLGSVVMLTVDASTDSLLYAYDINHPNVGKGMSAPPQ